MTRNIGIRPSLPTPSAAIQPRGDVSAPSFSRLAQLALYNRGQGAMVVPWCGSGSSGSGYNTGVSSETFRFAYWSSGVHFHRQWYVRFRWNSAGEVTLAAGTASITVNLGYKQEVSSLRYSPQLEDTVTFDEYFTASSGRHTPTLTVSGAVGSSWAVADIHCFEVPRSVFAKDGTDLGVNAWPISEGSPIRGDANEDWRGIYDIARTPTIKRGALYSVTNGTETFGSGLIARFDFDYFGAMSGFVFDNGTTNAKDDYPRMTAPIINASSGGSTRIGVSLYTEFYCSSGTITNNSWTWYDSSYNSYVKSGGSGGSAGGGWIHFDVSGSGAPILLHDDELDWTATDTITQLEVTLTAAGPVTGYIGVRSICIYEVP